MQQSEPAEELWRNSVGIYTDLIHASAFTSTLCAHLRGSLARVTCVDCVQETVLRIQS
jgi:hypothetical protein